MLIKLKGMDLQRTNCQLPVRSRKILMEEEDGWGWELKMCVIECAEQASKGPGQGAQGLEVEMKTQWKFHRTGRHSCEKVVTFESCPLTLQFPVTRGHSSFLSGLL